MGCEKCCVQSYKAVFHELWLLGFFSSNGFWRWRVRTQLELLSCSPTWVKSKLKSFQILESASLSLSGVPAGWDFDFSRLPNRPRRSHTNTSIFHRSSERHFDSGLMDGGEPQHAGQRRPFFIFIFFFASFPFWTFCHKAGFASYLQFNGSATVKHTDIRAAEEQARGCV